METFRGKADDPSLSLRPKHLRRIQRKNVVDLTEVGFLKKQPLKLDDRMRLR